MSMLNDTKWPQMWYLVGGTKLILLIKIIMIYNICVSINNLESWTWFRYECCTGLERRYHRSWNRCHNSG